jgi:hypothetical protein
MLEIGPLQFVAPCGAFLDAIRPEEHDSAIGVLAESVGDKIPYDVVHRLPMQDRRIKCASERCETSYERDGMPLRSIDTLQGITDLKPAQMDLERSKSNLAEAQRVADALRVHPDAWCGVGST